MGEEGAEESPLSSRLCPQANAADPHEPPAYRHNATRKNPQNQ